MTHIHSTNCHSQRLTGVWPTTATTDVGGLGDQEFARFRSRVIGGLRGHYKGVVEDVYGLWCGVGHLWGTTGAQLIESAVGLCSDGEENDEWM
jgi:hypothetical protein